MRLGRLLAMVGTVPVAAVLLLTMETEAAHACGTQVRSVGSLNIDWGSTCNVSQTSYRYSRLTGGVQRWLNQLGFNCGTADAVFGTQTASCVKQFQWAAMNRPPSQQTGVVDTGTWQAMEGLRALRGCPVAGVCEYSTTGGSTVLARRYDELYGVRGAWTIRNKYWEHRVWNTSSQWS